MVSELEDAWGLAARCLARRLGGALGAKLVSVQVVGRAGNHLPRRADEDLDVLVILAQWSRPLVHRVQRIGAEVERQFAAGLALKVTSPAQLENLGARGTPVWDLVETGIPLLAAPASEPRLALPSRPAPALPVHRLSREQAAEKTTSRLKSARTLLQCGQIADAVSLAHASLLSLAKAALPREDLQGRRESELFRLLLRAVPGGALGEWPERLRELRRLRNGLDLGCQALEDSEAAARVVTAAEELAGAMLAPAVAAQPSP